MSSAGFEKLDIWNDGKQLATLVFKLWDGIDEYRYHGLRNQMQRAVVSIPSNIAEGSERRGAKEFMQYLFIAKGSAGELRTQLYILKSLNIFDESAVNEMLEKCHSLVKRIQKLIVVVKSKK